VFPRDTESNKIHQTQSERPTPTVIRTLLLGISMGLAIVLALMVSLVLVNRLPSGTGIAFELFHYDGETVGVSLFGGFAPVFFSAALIPALRPVRALRGPVPWAAIAGICALFIGIFGVSHDWYSGLTLTRSWASWLASFGAGLGIVLGLTRKRLGLFATALELYAIGTLGTFASDVARTLSYQSTAPGQALVWGGGGLQDLVLWFGIYMALGYLFFRLVLVILGQNQGFSDITHLGGRFNTKEGRLLVAFRDPEKCITISLKDEQYDKVIVQVEDKDQTAELINRTISKLGGPSGTPQDE
jgi:hypothetical protein